MILNIQSANYMIFNSPNTFRFTVSSYTSRTSEIVSYVIPLQVHWWHSGKAEVYFIQRLCFRFTGKLFKYNLSSFFVVIIIN